MSLRELFCHVDDFAKPSFLDGSGISCRVVTDHGEDTGNSAWASAPALVSLILLQLPLVTIAVSASIGCFRRFISQRDHRKRHSCV